MMATNTFLPKSGTVSAFAMIVDINGYAKIASSGYSLIAQFARDVLSGGIKAVEKSGGEVVGFMGDAFYALMDDSDKVYSTCVSIAHDLSNMYTYFSSEKDVFPFTAKNFGLKIGIEYGVLDISTIRSKFLGEQQIFTGIPVNYAARILSAGKGNRCLIGPNAFEQGLKEYDTMGPKKVKGKKGEGDYVYYSLDLDEFWPD